MRFTPITETGTWRRCTRMPLSIGCGNWDGMLKQQHPIESWTKTAHRLAIIFADLLVDDRLIVEIKAARSLTERTCRSDPGIFEVHAD